MVWLEQYKRYVTKGGLVYRRTQDGKLKLCSIHEKKGKDKYPMVSVAGKSNQRHEQYVHRLVALAFVPNPDNKPLVDHINRDKTDCRAENLRWVSYSENGFNSDRSDACFTKYGCGSRTKEYRRVYRHDYYVRRRA